VANPSPLNRRALAGRTHAHLPQLPIENGAGAQIAMSQCTETRKKISKLAHNILDQAESLAGILQHQCGEGAPALAQASDLLRSGRRVLITGIGASLFASIPLEYFLCSLGIDAVAIEAAELLHYRHVAFRDAVAVVVSRSGESIEIAKLLEMLKGRQPIIGVSNEPQSLLARNADVSICIGSLADEMVAIQTYTGTLLTHYLLAGTVTDTLEAAQKKITTLLPAFSELVDSSMSDLSKWDVFLRPDSPVYLLARGPSCASAYEGALLLNEVAKSAAVGMATASFRHGPVEVVDHNFRGLVFAPQDNTRELNLALAHDLAQFGGRVRVVGPALDALAPDLQGCEVPAVPKELAPLFEIVPVQAAALRMAELRGVRPGSFRYAPQVAVDEASFGQREVL
jgi:glucosamine--fructose-6-phosphate aminotransferase (isomerizing)